MNGNNPQSGPPPPGWRYGAPPRTAMFFRAIQGPIILITLGVLFALHQAGILSFGRTWPLLIIVIGLVKLLERLAVPRNLPPPGGPY